MLRDISIVVHDRTPEWPGDTPYRCRWTWELSRGDSVNVSAFTMSPHVGTHADAPLHVADGRAGADRLPLEPFLGPAAVVSVEGWPSPIDWEQLQTSLPGAPLERLLLRTGQSIASGRFPESWPALSATCARQLVDRGLRLLGVDAPSVDERESRTLDVHHTLFVGGACNLENLDLRETPDGWYELIAFPLRLHGLDAAPVRAALRPLGA